jgi:hypothetical protein
MNSPSPRQRWLILGVLLLGTVTAAVLVEDDPDTLEPVERPAKRKTAPKSEATAGAVTTASVAVPASTPEKEEKPGDKADAPEAIDPFRTKTWHIAPPPPPPPTPRAPPLPFQFIGQLIEEGEARAFINHQGRNLIIKTGDVINGTYLVEEIAAGKIVFVYQPLQERQVLSTGAV